MGWRTKLVFLLVVYAAGFLTAIYCLAPTPKNKSHEPLQMTQARVVLQSEALARSVNSGLHKCIDFGKEAAAQAAKFMRERMQQAKSPSKHTN